MKLRVSLDTKSTKARTFSVSCYWIAWNGKNHRALPLGARNVTLSAASPQSFELVDKDTFGRTDGNTKGIVNRAGTYRGWAVSVHDATGKKVAGCANIGEFERLVP